MLGDSVNYAIGRYIGPKAFHRPQDTWLGRWLKPEYLDRTTASTKIRRLHDLIGRFVPIVRTFAPFLAGVGAMTYQKFLCYNVIGAAAWVGSLAYAGYLFGNIPWVKENLHWIVLAIVIVSLLPIAVQFVKERRARTSPDVAEDRSRPR